VGVRAAKFRELFANAQKMWYNGEVDLEEERFEEDLGDTEIDCAREEQPAGSSAVLLQGLTGRADCGHRHQPHQHSYRLHATVSICEHALVRELLDSKCELTRAEKIWNHR